MYLLLGLIGGSLGQNSSYVFHTKKCENAEKISTEEMCEGAMEELNKSRTANTKFKWKGLLPSVLKNLYPYGCIIDRGNEVYFNHLSTLPFNDTKGTSSQICRIAGDFIVLKDHTKKCTGTEMVISNEAMCQAAAGEISFPDHKTIGVWEKKINDTHSPHGCFAININQIYFNENEGVDLPNAFRICTTNAGLSPFLQLPTEEFSMPRVYTVLGDHTKKCTGTEQVVSNAQRCKEDAGKIKVNGVFTGTMDSARFPYGCFAIGYQIFFNASKEDPNREKVFRICTTKETPEDSISEGRSLRGLTPRV